MYNPLRKPFYCKYNNKFVFQIFELNKISDNIYHVEKHCSFHHHVVIYIFDNENDAINFCDIQNRLYLNEISFVEAAKKIPKPLKINYCEDVYET